MIKIAFIGAGSFNFTRRLIRDILSFESLSDAHIHLMDIDAEKLGFITTMVNKIVAMGNYPAQITSTMDRAEALKDADFVVVTILAGGVDIWRHDIEIPKKYGVDLVVGDTRGPSGIFRVMRTIPIMLDIARDIEHYCPNALMLNYTNPMAMLCRTLQRETHVRAIGLCHSVQNTARKLAEWIGAPQDEITYTSAGLNHLSWYIEFAWNGRDALPLIRQAITENEAVYNADVIRNEIFLHLGYYITESPGHTSEYLPWFRKRPELIQQYVAPCTHRNPGNYAFLMKQYLARETAWKAEIRKWLEEDAPISLERGHEYAACIMHAVMGGEPFEFNGNVANTGIITNLPRHCCVEVPVWASRKGLHPVHVGELPASVAPITCLTAMTEEMAVEAAVHGDPDLIYHAICHDPLTAAVLSLAEIKDMVNEMFEQNKRYLPQFKHTKV